MKLGYIIIYVSDVPKTVTFYETAFNLKRRFIHESHLYAEMETGSTALAFAGTEPPPTKVEGFSGLERLRRTVGSFPTEVGGFKPDFWKMNYFLFSETCYSSFLF